MEDPDTSATAKQLKNSTRQPGCSSTTMEDPDSFSTTKLEMLRQLFLYECEKSCAKKLKSVISSKNMVESVRIPGAKVEENNPEIKIATELNKLTRPARTIGKGLTQIMSVMHSLGFSLNGSFAVQDIFCLPGLKIKLRADLKKSICKATDETNRQDYLKLRKIMKNDLLAGCPIPKDVEVWLFHMRNDPIKNEPLIRYNLCLMDQVVQLSHLRTLYERFKQIEAVEKIRAEIMKEMASKNQGRNEMDDETQASASKDATEQTKNNELRRSGSKVSKVLSYMRSGEKNWFPAAEHNQFVLEAYNYHLRLTDGINKDERSLTTILRHCANHLIDYSVDEETGEILFQDFEMYYIIEGTFPGALSKFQQGMHSIGELEYPSLNEQMRARMSWFE